MNSSALYPFLSTGLILITIFVNYMQRVNTDRFQRKIYLAAIASIFVSIIFNFTGSMLEGRPGPAIHAYLLCVNTLFFIFQQCSYFLTVVFIDYIANRNNVRAKKFLYIISAVMAVNIVIMVLNIFSGFYFYITNNNQFMFSDLYLIRFYMSYSAVLVAVIDIFLSAKQLRYRQIFIVSIFAIFCGIGGTLEIVFQTGNFIWAAITAAMLAAYFDIIHRDTTQDSITGIGNRSSFTEFITQAGRLNVKQSFSMALFDINGLEKINSNHGIRTGDKALAEVAALIKSCSRQSDFVARIGDDEFIMVIKAKYDIEKLLGRILHSLNDRNQHQDMQYVLSLSYGYDTFSTHTEQTTDEFLQSLKYKVHQHKKEQQNDAEIISGETGNV